MNIGQLDRQIKAVCPVAGINSDGVIFFKPSASTSQRANAQALMDAHLAELNAPPTEADEIAAYKDEVRALRETVLNRLAGIGVAALASHNNQLSGAILDARQALLDITADPGVLGAQTKAEVEVAFAVAWSAIRNAAPAELRSAFSQVGS